MAASAAGSGRVQRSDGKRSEYLLYEANLRKMLTNMYNAFRSVENSRRMLEKAPGEIGRAEYDGDELAKRSMKCLCEWLSSISALAKDDGTYRSVFLDPVRIVAKMRLELSRMRVRSACVDALVFAQMPYYDKEYNTRRIIASTVAPGLQAPMSIRVSTSEASLRHGYHAFENCQPMPLVNRIHQTAGTVRPSERRMDLSEFDCLYTALEDIASLGRSLEMESFCEVPSPDAEPRQRLAAPFVTFGTVEMVRGPSVYVKSLDGKHSVKLMAENQVSDLSGDLGRFERKTARLLGAQWYEPAKDRSCVPENPALYCVEADDDLGALRLQEACGRVRIRGSVSADHVPGSLRGQLEALRCIRAAKGRISYAFLPARDAVSKSFLRAHGDIRRMRSRFNAVQITEDQVIDRRKSGVNGLAGVLTSRKYGFLGALLMDFVMRADVRAGRNGGAAGGTAPGGDRGMARLRSFGIAEKTGGDWSLTKKGRDVAKEVAKRLASRIPKGDLPALLHPDSLTERGIPPSLTISLLRGRALGEYRPARAGEKTTYVYWVGQLRGAEADEEARAALEDFERRVLETMGSVSHSSTAAGIADRVRESAFVVDLLLSEMYARADSPVRPDGGSWEYTITARVRDAFERETHKMMSKDDVAGMIGVGLVRMPEVREAVESLVRSGVAARLGGGLFSHNSDLASKKGAQRDQRLQEAVMKALSPEDGVEDDLLVRALVKSLDDEGMEGGELDKIECVRRVLNRMEDGGLIWRNGSRILKQAP